MPTKIAPTPKKLKRGFAAMTAEARRRIAAKGGAVSAKKQKRDAFGQFGGNRRR